MITTRLLTISRPALRNSARAASTQPQQGKDPRQSQGHAAADHRHNVSAQDVQSQSVQSGLSNSEKAPQDAASRDNAKHAPPEGSGNLERIGFADQVGSQSGGTSEARGEGKGATEESKPTGILGTIKSKLGLGTNLGDTK